MRRRRYLRDVLEWAANRLELFYTEYPREKEFIREGAFLMKNPNEVLRMKEQEILRIKIEIEALRVTARLLSDENSVGAAAPQRDQRQLVEMP